MTRAREGWDGDGGVGMGRGKSMEGVGVVPMGSDPPSEISVYIQQIIITL